MKLKYLLLSICCLTLLFVTQTNEVNAQITIGSDHAPNDGSLLDLKEMPNIGVNSTRGLMLPRVSLTSGDSINKDIPTVGEDEFLDHIGLTVYNTTDNFCGNHPLAKGIQVWQGDQWRYIGPEIKDPAVSVFTDSRDGEKYYYRTFDSAGTWMIENLRARRFEGATEDIPVDEGLNEGMRFPRIAFPSFTPQEDDDERFDYTKPDPARVKEGLLYNWYAATGYSYDAARALPNQGEGTADEVEHTGPNGPDKNGNMYVQGICPAGWHLPSDREWNRLEQELYENGHKYSTYKESDFPLDPEQPEWKPEWNTYTTAEYRGSDNIEKGHSLIMLNVCTNAVIVTTDGVSYPAEYGGFNLYLSGYGNNGTIAQNLAAVTTASAATSSGHNWLRVFFNDIQPDAYKVDRIYINFASLTTVRCKKTE